MDPPATNTTRPSHPGQKPHTRPHSRRRHLQSSCLRLPRPIRTSGHLNRQPRNTGSTPPHHAPRNPQHLPTLITNRSRSADAEDSFSQRPGHIPTPRQSNLTIEIDWPGGPQGANTVPLLPRHRYPRVTVLQRMPTRVLIRHGHQ